MNHQDANPGQATDSGDAAPVDPWRLCRRDRDPARAALDETLFALANGSLGVRGGVEEADSASDGTFLAAAYVQTPIHHHERLPGFARSTDTRVPVAEGKGIEVWLGDRRLDPAAAEWRAFERSLDLRDGCLRRSLRLRTAEGATIELHAERVVPLEAADVLAIRFAVTSIDYAGPLALVSTLVGGQRSAAQGDDPRIGAAGGEGLRDDGGEAGEAGASLRQSARGGGLRVHAGQGHRVGDGLRFVAARAGAGRVEQRYEATLAPGRTVALEKFVAYACEDDASVASAAARVDAALRASVAAGFDALVAGQAAALRVFWDSADLLVTGAPDVEQALRFNLFHLLQSAGRNGIDGTAAKGLTGEGYEGHCFWDTEAFVLPVMAFVAPEVARAMLRYRYRTLDAARAHARELNHPRGALYAWRTIAGGECSAHYPSGSAAYHINAAVAHAIGLYLDASDDLDFIADAGAEILFETARIWPQIGHFNPRRGGAFCIHEVTGPDEYTALVDNNHYTNAMAKRHLLRAVEVWRRLREARPRALAALAARIGLDEAEVALWRRAAEAMHLDLDPALGIPAQDDAFLGRPRWPFPFRHLPSKPGGHRPLLLDYHPITLYRHQVCKQADVALALVLAGDGVDVACKKRSYDYYEAVTTHDSTLSASVYGILAAEVGHGDKALRHFLDSLRVDLDDLHGNTGHGVHMAAMAGSWLGLTHGFGGLRVRDGALAFAPVLPPGWNGYAFALRWRARTLRVSVSGAGVEYRLLAGPALTIAHDGRTLALAPGDAAVRPLAMPHAGAKAAFPRRCEALIFDLDGVLTDTARTHYRAWKRLADEIGVPFDATINERLKGVDRMASLEIVLERAARAYDDDEKRALAERKNGYYVEAIAGFGPDDLFPGARALLARARAAGLKTGLASASRNAPQLLERLGIADLFDYVADAGRIARAKPHPDIFLDVADALGVAPVACIGIEDAAAGIDAIHAACMPAVGIGDAAALGRADAVVPTIADFVLGDFVLDAFVAGLAGPATTP